MWIYLSSIYQKVNYIRKSREKFRLRNRNLDTYLAGYLNGFAEKWSPNFTAYGPGATNDTKSTVYKFQFKNLVLAGGGAKGIAYCGVARALEEHGILKDIQRFAGVGVGALVAALLCIGFNSHDVERLMYVNMEGLLKDQRSETFSFRLYLRSLLGWHQVDKLTRFLKDVFDMKIYPDITFKQAYDEGKELCILVANTNTEPRRYCHVNTTPHMKIRDAVRMSLSTPDEFKTIIETIGSKTSLSVDGVVLYNYPIDCFDGWIPIDGIKPEHQQTNFETLGCLVYSEDQYITFRDQIEKNCKVPNVDVPDTKLSREEKTNQFLHHCVAAQLVFLKSFVDRRKQEIFEFELDEFEQRVKKSRQSRSYFEMKYGTNVNAKMIFDDIERKNDKKVTLYELFQFCGEMCKTLAPKCTDVILKKHVDNVFQRVLSVHCTSLYNVLMEDFFKEDDVARTIGINTWYIKTFDFALEEGDRQFLIDQGKRSTEKFLTQFAQYHRLPLDKSILSREVPTDTSLSGWQWFLLNNYTYRP